MHGGREGGREGVCARRQTCSSPHAGSVSSAPMITERMHSFDSVASFCFTRSHTSALRCEGTNMSRPLRRVAVNGMVCVVAV